MVEATCSKDRGSGVEELARRSREVFTAASERTKRAMPFLLRWRDRLVYSIILSFGAGAILSAWDGRWAAAAILPAGFVLFALFRGYDRAAAHAPEFTPEERIELMRLAAAISQLTRPADEPEFSYWRPRRPTMGTSPCGWCGAASRTYPGPYRPQAASDAGAEAACVDCLRNGRAATPVTDGELLTLRSSIAGSEPQLFSVDLDMRVRAAAEELRRTPSPPAPWPQCCADFCRFEGAWGVGEFAVAAGSFDAAVLSDFLDHALGRSHDRSPAAIEAAADSLAASESLWDVFRCRRCGRLFASPMAGGD